MTKKELIEALKEFSDDTEITLQLIDPAIFDMDLLDTINEVFEGNTNGVTMEYGNAVIFGNRL